MITRNVYPNIRLYCYPVVPRQKAWLEPQEIQFHPQQSYLFLERLIRIKRCCNFSRSTADNENNIVFSDRLPFCLDLLSNIQINRDISAYTRRTILPKIWLCNLKQRTRSVARWISMVVWTLHWSLPPSIRKRISRHSRAGEINMDSTHRMFGSRKLTSTTVKLDIG